MKRFMCTLLFIFSLSSVAYERSYYSSAAGEHIIYSYEEQERWLLKEVLIPVGKLQTEIFSKSFDSKTELLKFKNKKSVPDKNAF